MIYIILFIIGCLLIRINELKKEKNIYYNNYIQCLTALSEYDTSLKEYLKEVNR